MSDHDPTDPIYRAATIIEAHRSGHVALDSWDIVGELMKDDLLLTQEVKALVASAAIRAAADAAAKDCMADPALTAREVATALYQVADRVEREADR